MVMSLKQRKIKFKPKIEPQNILVFPKTTPGASSGFANVKRRALVAGHPVNKNLGMPDEMVMDGKETANQTVEF